MDQPEQPTLPTAAELGISEEEYARILRGLPGRASGAAPLAAAAAPEREAPGRRTRVGRALLSMGAGMLALSMLGPRLGGADPGQPTYAFLNSENGRPVTYTSCRPIQVAVFPAGGPPDAVELVEEAVTRVRSATGLDVVVTGVFGGHAPNWNFAAGPVHPEDPISVSWQDGAAIAELTDHTAGLGGSRTVTNPDGSQRLVAGTIALSRDYYAMLAERGDHAEELAVMLHEFGHVFGLDHVDSPGELMYHENLDVETYAAGDLAGLRLLGQGPCV